MVGQIYLKKEGTHYLCLYRSQVPICLVVLGIGHGRPDIFENGGVTL